jgi:hypothetical protein
MGEVDFKVGKSLGRNEFRIEFLSCLEVYGIVLLREKLNLWHVFPNSPEDQVSAIRSAGLGFKCNRLAESAVIISPPEKVSRATEVGGQPHVGLDLPCHPAVPFGDAWEGVEVGPLEIFHHLFGDVEETSHGEWLTEIIRVPRN